MSELPGCPLCGTEPLYEEVGAFGVPMVTCSANDDPGHTEEKPYCELAGMWFTPQAWHRLAFPRGATLAEYAKGDPK
jgi:hypothetical protein